MNKFIRWYNQNRKSVWATIGIIILIIVVIQLINNFYKVSNEEELDKKEKQKQFFKFLEVSQEKVVPSNQIPSNWQGCDIGPRTIEMFAQELKNKKTILWNGPLGICE